MKKLLPILLCMPLIFFCGDDKKDNKKENNVENNVEKTYDDIRGYWQVTWPGDKDPSRLWYFAPDSFFCSDVNLGASCGKNDEIKQCDDCLSDNHWKYTNDEKNRITLTGGKNGFPLMADIKEETDNRYVLSFIFGPPGEMILERTTFTEIKRKYDEKKREREEYRKKAKEEQRIKEEEKKKEEQEEVETYKEKYQPYYGVINDPDGYTNVREEKSSKSEIGFKIYEGEKFEIIDDSDDNWWMIEYNGEQGYIYRDRIDIIE